MDAQNDHQSYNKKSSAIAVKRALQRLVIAMACPIQGHPKGFI